MKNTTINIRVPETIKQAAQAAAAEDDRTLSGYIVNLINRDLKAKATANDTE